MKPQPPTALITARLLTAWGPLEAPCWILLIVALAMLWLRPVLLLALMGSLSLLTAAYGLYLGGRIRFDAAIFLDLADGRIADGETFDATLKEMGFSSRSPRSEAERCRGALRLLYQRIFCFMIQVAALAVGVLVH